MINRNRIECWGFIFIFALILLPFVSAPLNAQLIIPNEVPRQESPADNLKDQTEQLSPGVEEEEPAASDSAIVTANLLNVRDTPSLSGQVKATLEEGTIVKTVSFYGGEWVRIEYGQGQEGWVHGDYLLIGDAYSRGMQMMGTKRGFLQGTWRGSWEKRQGGKSDAVLHILHLQENKIIAAGTVKGWTCWEIYVGEIENSQVRLQAIAVEKSQQPASQYVPDNLTMNISEKGVRLEGQWFDSKGSAGKVEYRFFALEETIDKDIWDIITEYD